MNTVTYNKKEREKIYRSMRRIFRNFSLDTMMAEYDKFDQTPNTSIKRFKREKTLEYCKEYTKLGTGFCGLLRYVYQVPSPNAQPVSIEKFLPELWQARPVVYYSTFWWFHSKDHGRRADILTEIIRKIENKKPIQK